MKYVVLFLSFSAAIAVGQCRASAQQPFLSGPHIQRIVGGADVMTEEFPFVAKIIYSGSQVGCTGSLIAPDRVLTAGHCAAGYSVGDLSVGFGNTRTLEPRYQVVDVILHPEYSNLVNDIAILKLESSVPIQPIPILTLEEELQYAASGSGGGIAVGWGSTALSGEGGPMPETLQHLTNLPIYIMEDCVRAVNAVRNRNSWPSSVHEQIICAGEKGRSVGGGGRQRWSFVGTHQPWLGTGWCVIGEDFAYRRA